MSEDCEPTQGRNSAAWITAIAAHQDRLAFAALFEFYAPRIKAMMMHAGTSADAGEIIAQDALLAVWRKAAHFDRNRQTASTWIYTIARSVWGTRLRSEKLSKIYADNRMPDAGNREHPVARTTPRNAVGAFALALTTQRQRQSSSRGNA